MDLLFATPELQRLCTEQVAMIDRWGTGGAAVVGQRLQEVEAADRLADLRLLPHLRVVADDDADEVIVEGRDGVRLRLAPRQANPNRRRAARWHEAQTAVVLDVVFGGDE
ncbi:MAG: hypothetical protein ACRDI0_08905 [Actinomycetota bacterium]